MAEGGDQSGSARDNTKGLPKALQSVTSQSMFLDPSLQSCPACKELDTLEMVQCDTCRSWFHFGCAGVSSDIVNKDFVCEKCKANTSATIYVATDGKSTTSERTRKSGASKSSTVRSEARRKQLALERVEEERKLKESRDKEYLDKKYQTLQSFNIGDSSESEPDETTNRGDASNYTSQWVESQSNLVHSAGANQEVSHSAAQGDAHPFVTQRKRSNNVQNSLPQEVLSLNTDQLQQIQTDGRFWQWTDQQVTANFVPSSNVYSPITPETILNNSFFQANVERRSTLVQNPVQTQAPTNEGWNEYDNLVTSNSQGVPRHLQSVMASFSHIDPQRVDQFQQSMRNKWQTTAETNLTISNGHVSTSAVNVLGMSNGAVRPANTTEPCVVSSRIQPPLVPYTSRPSTTQFTGFQQSTGAYPYQSHAVPRAIQSSGHIYTNASGPVMGIGANQFSSILAPRMPPPTTIRASGVCYPSTSAPQYYRMDGSSQNVGGQSIPPNSVPQIIQTFGPHQFQRTMPPSMNQNFGDPNATFYTGAYGATNPAPIVGHQLTQSQISARQVVPRKLPVFNGEIEKFPAFISAYETSTELCGFTHGENLGRLRESLKDVAMDMVEQQLLYPDDVPHVIASLKLVFGNPEFVINKLMEKVSKQPPPRAEDLSSIIKFSMSVQNICGTIRASNLTEHLRNPTLMKALVDKLPPSIQINWACYRQSIPDANLNTLGTWLYDLARLASSIAGPPKVKKEKAAEKSNHKANRETDSDSNPDMSGYVNAQIESSTKKVNNATTPKVASKCPVCNQGSCQRVKDCKKFISLNLSDRWAVVKEKQLCIRCFGYHRIKLCKSKQKCNVVDCQRDHNSLLHENDKNENNPDSEATEKVEESDTSNVNCSHQSTSRKVDIFRIVPVKLYNNNRTIQTFAYLDDGSNVTTMDNELADELHLESSAQENLCVKWSFGKIRREELVSKRVSVGISGIHPNAVVYDLHNVRTVNDLALPCQTLSQRWLESYKHFEGIPITPYENARPRMLIGLPYSKLMVSHKSIEGSWTEPIVCKTRLGWIVQGPDGGDGKDTDTRDHFSLNICECQQDDSSSNGLKSPGQFNPKNLIRDVWEAVQQLTNQFWTQFVVEYLPTLTRRTKWFKDVKPLEVGNLVLVVDEQSDRNDGRKGIVEEIGIGKGKVRRARVRMIRGEKANLVNTKVENIKHQLPWRPASKLAVLDVTGFQLNISPEPVNGERNVENAA